MASSSGYNNVEELFLEDDTSSKKVQSRDLRSGRLLGRGSSSIVYETTWKGQSYARKDFLRVPSATFEREASALVGLEDHPNVVRTYCWTVDEGSCSLVSELMDDNLLNMMRKRKTSQRNKGQKSGSHLIDLQKFIEECKIPPVVTAFESVAPSPLHPFDMTEALQIIAQIAEGMKFLHENGVVHGDLKPKNVLLTSRKEVVPGSLAQDVAFHVKVADFGLFETKMKSMSLVSRQVRNLEMIRWRAPELLEKGSLSEYKHESSMDSDWDSDSSIGKINLCADNLTYSTLVKADVYNFALTCSQIITGEDPYLGLGLNDLVKKAVDFSLRPGLPPKCPPQLRDLLESCWGETTERPSFQAILSKLKYLLRDLDTDAPSGPNESLDAISGEESLDAPSADSEKLNYAPIGQVIKDVQDSSATDSAKGTRVLEQQTWRPMNALRSNKLDWKARHFLGLDEEIEWETRGIPKRNLPAGKALRNLDALMSVIHNYTTVVISVEEVRLFNAANQEDVRLRFPRKFYFSENLEEKIIEKDHSERFKVIRAITAPAATGSSTLTTVSFIPGEEDHVKTSLLFVVRECWRTELSEFCATLHQNPNLHNVHISTELSEGKGFNIGQLLNSSLVEISLPELQKQGWRDLALGLATNRTLRVLTLIWDADGMEAFVQTSVSKDYDIPLTWPKCNRTLEKLVITCTREFDLESDSECVASMLLKVSCVSTFVIEYYPQEPARKLTRFALSLQEALLGRSNARTLHLHIPFHGNEIDLIVKPLLPGAHTSQLPANTPLAGLVLVPDRWTKADLTAVGNMLRSNTSITHFAIRQHLRPRKNLSLWQPLQRIGEPEVADFLRQLCANSTLQTLSLRGWSVVHGKQALNSALALLRIQTALHIDFTGTGLASTNSLEPLHAHLTRNAIPGSQTSSVPGSHAVLDIGSATWSGSQSSAQDLSSTQDLCPLHDSAPSGSSAYTLSYPTPLQSVTALTFPR